jgi:formylmethanofuran dehydrogenase subunit E
MNAKPLAVLLKETASMHKHLCPRQVLAVRLGMYARELLGIDLPQTGKQLLSIVETDGCTFDGVSVATNCWPGRRTLRVEDYGKVAASLIDMLTGKTFRIIPKSGIREQAAKYAKEARGKWESQLIGFQRMPNEVLLHAQEVELTTSLEQINGRPKGKAICGLCGEEVINQREVYLGEAPMCQPCSGQSYYMLKEEKNRMELGAISY